VSFPEVNSRRLHTRENGEFKRQNGMPAMKIRSVAARKQVRSLTGAPIARGLQHAEGTLPMPERLCARHAASALTSGPKGRRHEGRQPSLHGHGFVRCAIAP
jgi:hypothetical protein